MKLNVFVTLLAPTVLMLASINVAAASNTSTTRVAAPAVQAPSAFHASMSITRSTNLIDFQDGTRNDSLDYELSPYMKVSFGTFMTSLSYSQNLRDKYSRTASDWGDISVTFAFKPSTWKWSDDQNAKISYSLTAVIPVSQSSVKKDQLQTSVSGKIGFAIAPVDGGFSYAMGISAGRNLHAFEEDINGSVLNQYSSNQNLNLGYEVGSWNIGLSFVNRTRWSYQNNVKSSFAINEEIGYAIDQNISFAIGHTNSGSTLKANGTDSNIDLFNENNSTVYATLGLSY